MPFLHALQIREGRQEARESFFMKPLLPAVKHLKSPANASYANHGSEMPEHPKYQLMERFQCFGCLPIEKLPQALLLDLSDSFVGETEF
jgi:hypothetical protein